MRGGIGKMRISRVAGRKTAISMKEKGIMYRFILMIRLTNKHPFSCTHRCTLNLTET
jgi:hypothetical protein